MKTILAELNTVITSLEEKGLLKEASELNDVFMRFAQTSRKTHSVSSGETLTSIANKYGISVDSLYDANPGLSASLQPGQLISIPGKNETFPSEGQKLWQKGVNTVKNFLSPEDKTQTFFGGDIFGENARKATKSLKAALGMPGDESWGPGIADQIKRIFDGARIAKGMNKNQSGMPYNAEYRVRALNAYTNAGPIKNIIANNTRIYNLAEALDQKNEVHTIAQPGTMSQELIQILSMLSSYSKD